MPPPNRSGKCARLADFALGLRVRVSHTSLDAALVLCGLWVQGQGPAIRHNAQAGSALRAIRRLNLTHYSSSNCSQLLLWIRRARIEEFFDETEWIGLETPR